MMIEAFADAGVKYGLTRAQALQMTAATVRGTTKLLQETGKHPGELKDAVCSPGGSTIKGVTALEQAGFRANCICAIDAIMKK
jgi:pyrroline-5-carboxylate reductase